SVKTSHSEVTEIPTKYKKLCFRPPRNIEIPSFVRFGNRCQGRNESFPPGRRKRGPLLPSLASYSWCDGGRLERSAASPVRAARLGRSGSRLPSRAHPGPARL